MNTNIKKIEAKSILELNKFFTKDGIINLIEEVETKVNAHVMDDWNIYREIENDQGHMAALKYSEEEGYNFKTSASKTDYMDLYVSLVEAYNKEFANC